MKIYGISTCDTVRKARKHLDKLGLQVEFVDFKITPPSQDLIIAWCEQCDWTTLFNKRSTTYRQVKAEAEPLTKEKAISLMVKYPNLVKRPVLDMDTKLIIGYKSADYEAL